MRVLEGRAGALTGAFIAQDVANTLWAYATMGREPGAGVMRGLEGRAEAVAGTFNEQNVANTLWAYARMGRAPGVDLRRRLEERILQLVEDFTSQDIADTRWAYEQLGMALPAEVATGLEARHSAIAASLSAFVAAEPGRGVPEARCDAESVASGATTLTAMTRSTQVSEASTVPAGAEVADEGGWTAAKARGKPRR